MKYVFTCFYIINNVIVIIIFPQQQNAFDGWGLAKVPGSRDCVPQVWKVAVVLKVSEVPGFDGFRGSESSCGFEGFGFSGFDGVLMRSDGFEGFGVISGFDGVPKVLGPRAAEDMWDQVLAIFLFAPCGWQYRNKELLNLLAVGDATYAYCINSTVSNIIIVIFCDVFIWLRKLQMKGQQLVSFHMAPTCVDATAFSNCPSLNRLTGCRIAPCDHTLLELNFVLESVCAGMSMCHHDCCACCARPCVRDMTW